MPTTDTMTSVGTSRPPMTLYEPLLTDAKMLQRRGLTLSEIAELLGVARARVVKTLYVDVVKPKASEV